MDEKGADMGYGPRIEEGLSASMLYQALSSGPHRVGRRPVMLLVGNYGNGNIGDESILAQLLELIGDSCEVVVLSRHPERIKRLHGANAVCTLKLASIRAFLRADIFAIGGGGIFGRGMTILPKLLPGAALAARLLGKRTVYLAIGAYPATPTPVRQLLQFSALLSALVSVRDAASFDTMNVHLFGRSSHPVLVHDLAIDLSPVSRDTAARILRDKGVTITPLPLGLSIKATPSPELNERTVSVLANAVDWWCEHRTGDVVLFAFSGHVDYGLDEKWSDLALAKQLIRAVKTPDRLRIVGPDLHPRALKGVVGLTAGMIGLRLHAQIYAWSTGRPLLGLSFEEKSDAFLKSVGAERAALCDLDPQTVIEWMSLV